MNAFLGLGFPAHAKLKSMWKAGQDQVEPCSFPCCRGVATVGPRRSSFPVINIGQPREIYLADVQARLADRRQPDIAASPTSAVVAPFQGERTYTPSV